MEYCFHSWLRLISLIFPVRTGFKRVYAVWRVINYLPPSNLIHAQKTLGDLLNSLNTYFYHFRYSQLRFGIPRTQGRTLLITFVFHCRGASSYQPLNFFNITRRGCIPGRNSVKIFKPMVNRHLSLYYPLLFSITYTNKATSFSITMPSVHFVFVFF